MNDAAPTLSIVTAMYNSTSFLDRIHQSLLIQQFRDFEWILVDDGSSDSSVDRARTLELPGTRGVSVFRMPANTGGPLALAVGILKARGELITILDHDDELEPGILAEVSESWRRERGDPCLAGLIFQIINPKTGEKIGRVLKAGLRTTVSKMENLTPDVTDLAFFLRSDLIKREMSIEKMEKTSLLGLPLMKITAKHQVLLPSSLPARRYHRDNPVSQTNSIRLSGSTVATYAEMLNIVDRYALANAVFWFRHAVAMLRFSLAVHGDVATAFGLLTRTRSRLIAGLALPLALARGPSRQGVRVVSYEKLNLDDLADLQPL